ISAVIALDVETEPEVHGMVERSLTLACRFSDASEHSFRRLLNWYMRREGDPKIEHVLSMIDSEDPTVYGTYAGRAEMLGEQGDMQITSLELVDEGVYTCEVDYYVAHEKGSGNTEVIISKIVDQITIFGHGEGRDGEQVVKYFPPGEPQTLICRASRAKPVALLKWYKDDEELTETEETYEESTDGTFNTINTLQFTSHKSDDGAVLKCETNQEPEIELKKSATMII
uniref:Cell adhesion molecule 3-like n=1 Tax=Saccoglossus kowalevskii TaxID=10224 RepID=A0ABM0MIX9_SACKO